FGSGLDLADFRIVLGCQFLSFSLSFGLQAFGLRLRFRVDSLNFGLSSGFDKLGLTHPFRSQDAIHNFLEVARENQVLDIRSMYLDPIARSSFLDVAQDVLA